MAENTFTINAMFYPATFATPVQRAWAITIGGFGIGYEQATETHVAPDEDYGGGPLSIFMDFAAPGPGGFKAAWVAQSSGIVAGSGKN